MADAELPCTEEEILTLLAEGGHPSGITPLKPGTPQYNAATDLIGEGVTFDQCDDSKPCTILYLKNTTRYNKYKQYPWASSARLDNQGDITSNNLRFARLAIQMQNETNAQANVQIGVKFGKRAIRHKLVESLNTAEVEWLSSNKSFIAKATSEGHQVMTLEMCQALDKEDEGGE